MLVGCAPGNGRCLLLSKVGPAAAAAAAAGVGGSKSSALHQNLYYCSKTWLSYSRLKERSLIAWCYDVPSR